MYGNHYEVLFSLLSIMDGFKRKLAYTLNKIEQEIKLNLRVLKNLFQKYIKLSKVGVPSSDILSENRNLELLPTT